MRAEAGRRLPALAGTILLVAGTYQFTGWKQICLDKFQSPFAFVAMHDFEGGAACFAPVSFTGRTNLSPFAALRCADPLADLLAIV